MGLIEDNTKEKAMSGIEGGSTTESEATKNSKSKKRCEAIKLANRLVFSVVVLIPFDPKQRAPCWVFITELLHI